MGPFTGVYRDQLV